MRGELSTPLVYNLARRWVSILELRLIVIEPTISVVVWQPIATLLRICSRRREIRVPLLVCGARPGKFRNVALRETKSSF